MTFRRITLIALAVLVLLATITTLVISRIDTDTYRDALEQAVAERLNATLDIGGPLTLRWFPSPRVSAEDLSLMQGETQVASADKVEISLRWATLWRGEPVLRSVTLASPSLHLVRDTEGHLNLQRTQAAPDNGRGFRLASLHVENGTLSLTQQTQGASQTFDTRSLTLDLRDIHLQAGDAPFIQRVALQGQLQADTLDINGTPASDVAFDIDADDGLLALVNVRARLLDGASEGSLTVDYSDETPVYDLTLSLHNFSLQQFLQQLSPDQQASGQLAFTASLRTRGRSLDDWLAQLNGDATLRGDQLVIEGLDIDQELSRYQSTQRFNLVDLGALAFAGPLGIAATKGAGFARLFDRTQGSSDIAALMSDWTIHDGIAHARDTAMATEKNRLVMLGDIDLGKRRFSNTRVAVVDRRGCAIMEQGITGPFSSPRVQSVSYVKALLGAPLDLLRQGLSLVEMDEECEAVYEGSVAAP
ncbi:hypothetical protein A167_00012 [Alcanivorax sp. S71-1-4]|uniref:AsmA family protein n=1 Tax=Alcanivorax sp. S71-1-4 TaxID=1177159 RepID=UPI00135CC1C2|nr:AsmA family protein [Alcanivorax sp. S71-1-4]KAF0810980.1 hypothetical protein A167_00012 [Alcanivorax sp. S71-1-4]